MHREATSKPAQALHCLRCGAPVPADCSRCPQCGQPALRRFDTHAAASRGKLAPAMSREPPRRPDPPMTRPQRWASAALPRRLTAADPNGARRWGLSKSVAVVLFGFALAFGTYVAMTEHESAQEMWRMVEASRHPEEARTAARHSAREESQDSGPSALSPDSPNSLVASLRQQIDSARADAANDAARVNEANDSMPKRGSTPRNASLEPAPAQPESPSLTHSPAGEPSLPAAQVPQTETTAARPSPAPSVQPAPLAPRSLDEAAEAPQPQTHAGATPARCDAQDASTCKTGAATIDSQTQRQTRNADHTTNTNTMQLGAVTRQIQENVPSRRATTKQSAKSRPVERVASATPKSTVRHAHRRPSADTARPGSQTRRPTQADTPQFAQTGRPWRFLMPPADRRAPFSATPQDIYRGR